VQKLWEYGPNATPFVWNFHAGLGSGTGNLDSWCRWAVVSRIYLATGSGIYNCEMLDFDSSSVLTDSAHPKATGGSVEDTVPVFFKNHRTYHV
jgi:hypothetical protein